VWNARRLVRLAEGLPVVEVPLAAVRELDGPYWFGAEDDVPTSASPSPSAPRAA
jgi:hypothetical protein